METPDSDGDARNSPKAWLMALLASLTFNIGVGCVMGTPGVLLPHLKQHLGVSTELISAGMLAILLSSAVFAPMVGAMAVRQSLRWMLGAASLVLSAAWLLLALTHSFAVFMAVDGLLFGPVMAVMGSVLAPTLVTRWFNRNRGLAIGLVHLPILVAIMPVAAEWLIQQIGLQATFLVLAALPLITTLPASFFVQDWPPEQRSTAGGGADARHGPSVTILQMLRKPLFWALSLAVAIPNTSSVLLGQHLVSMAESWGIRPLAAAGLASLMSLFGMVGAVGLGFVADRIGGARTLAMMAAADAVLWLCLLGRPGYPALAAIIGLIGLFGGGAIPAISKAYADAFGRASFSRAIGLMAPMMMPAVAIGLIGPGIAVRLHGDYVPVILGMAAAFVLSVALALVAAASKAQRIAQPFASL
jgi:MFS family permease